MARSTNTSASAKSTTPEAAKIASKSSLVLSVATAIAFGLLLGFLAQLALTSEFLGSGTRLVDRCKQNPKSDPEACAPIIEARTPAKRKSSRASGIPEKTSPFQLSED
jgi:hypothetical protein